MGSQSFTGTQLAGKSIAVIGLGRIGLTVARRCIAFEMKVLGYDPFLSEERARAEGIELYRDIDDLVGKCDFLTVHTPMTPETEGLINATRIAKMKKGVRLINGARGGIIDEKALFDAIQSGHVAGACTGRIRRRAAQGLESGSVASGSGHTSLGASTEEAQELVAVERPRSSQVFWSETKFDMPSTWLRSLRPR